MAESGEAASRADWPDVALALIDFAREDTLAFVGVLAATGVVVWCLFPRATEALKAKYQQARSEHQNQLDSPTGDDNDD